nr:hypothetical protein [uncultured Treponema sp.]
MLIFPVKKKWYEKIKNGEKTIEYRIVKPYWTHRIEHNLSFFNMPLHCKIRLGYTNHYLNARITKIETIDGIETDLHYNGLVYAIHLSDVEMEE